MKKLLSAIIVATAAVFFVGCSSQSTPKQVAKSFWENVQQEKYDEAINLCAGIDELFSKDEKGFLAALLYSETKAWGKITKIKVVSVDKTDGGNKATVELEISTENSNEPLSKTMKAVKKNGKWYIDYGI